VDDLAGRGAGLVLEFAELNVPGFSTSGYRMTLLWFFLITRVIKKTSLRRGVGRLGFRSLVFTERLFNRVGHWLVRGNRVGFYGA
jgi:hypothetical protein